MEKLKPCPLCNREHELDVDEYGAIFRHKDMDWSKDSCFLMEQEFRSNITLDEFAEIWNHRPIEDALNAENARLTAEVEESNSLLRSAYQIALRNGEKTNWEAWRNQLRLALIRQHEMMYPKDKNETSNL